MTTRGPKPIYTPSEAIYRIIYDFYKHTSARRNLHFDLDRADFQALILEKCHYCNALPSNRKWNKSSNKNKHRTYYVDYNGLDRVDNDRGYVIDNVVPCCKICNGWKTNRGYDEFLAYMQTIYAHMGLS